MLSDLNSTSMHHDILKDHSVDIENLSYCQPIPWKDPNQRWIDPTN